MRLSRLFPTLLIMATTTSAYNILSSCTSCSRHEETRMNEILGELSEILGPVNMSSNNAADYDTEQMMSVASTFQYSSTPFERESFTLTGSPSSSDHNTFSFSLNSSTRDREVPDDGVLVLWFTGFSFDLPVAVDIVDGLGRTIFQRFVDVEVSNEDQKLAVPIKASDVASQVVGDRRISGLERESHRNLLERAKDAEFVSMKPILHIVTKRRSGRSKRKADMNTCPNRKYPAAGVGCCLYDFIVNFHELGWKNVIAPQKFNAFACAGECKARLVDQGSVIKTQFVDTGSFNRAKVVKPERSCCHVDRTEALDVVFVTHDKELITMEVSGLIAVRCSCT